MEKLTAGSPVTKVGNPVILRGTNEENLFPDRVPSLLPVQTAGHTRCITGVSACVRIRNFRDELQEAMELFEAGDIPAG